MLIVLFYGYWNLSLPFNVFSSLFSNSLFSLLAFPSPLLYQLLYFFSESSSPPLYFHFLIPFCRSSILFSCTFSVLPFHIFLKTPLPSFPLRFSISYHPTSFLKIPNLRPSLPPFYPLYSSDPLLSPPIPPLTPFLSPPFYSHAHSGFRRECACS